MTNVPDPKPAVGANAAVLVVEDDALVRNDYCRALGNAGYDCHCASGSAEAMGRLEETPEIGVIIVDIHMAGEDGIALLRCLGEGFASRAWLQVLLISGAPGLDTAIGGSRLQARDLLEKPERLRDLTDAVDRASANACRLHQSQLQHHLTRAAIGRLAADFDAAVVQLPAREQDGPDPGAQASRAPLAISGSTSGITPKMIERLLRWQLNRNRLFQEHYFSNPAWYMLLDLYLAEVKGRATSVTSLCLASDVPVTTALRRIEELEHDGVLVRRPDETDRRRTNVALRPEARKRMTECLAGLLAVVELPGQQG